MYATNSVSSKNNRSTPLIAGGMLAATGAALFSIPSSANASYVYVPVANGQIILSATSSAKVLSLNLPSNNHIELELNNFGGTGVAKAIEGKLLLNGSGNVQKLSLGQDINSGPNVKTVTNANALLRLKTPGAAIKGSFKTNAAKTYFAGFESVNGNLGYIELAVGSSAGNPDPGVPNELTVSEYAYQTGSITAGYAGPVPEASNTATALLLLACAGGSLTTWRRRKQVQVAA